MFPISFCATGIITICEPCYWRYKEILLVPNQSKWHPLEFWKVPNHCRWCTIQKVKTINFKTKKKKSLFNEQLVALMFSVYCRYELHCPIEKVEKDIAELLWWIFFCHCWHCDDPLVNAFVAAELDLMEEEMASGFSAFALRTSSLQPLNWVPVTLLWLDLKSK